MSLSVAGSGIRRSSLKMGIAQTESCSGTMQKAGFVLRRDSQTYTAPQIRSPQRKKLGNDHPKAEASLVVPSGFQTGEWNGEAR